MLSYDKDAVELTASRDIVAFTTGFCQFHFVICLDYGGIIIGEIYTEGDNRTVPVTLGDCPPVTF